MHSAALVAVLVYLATSSVPGQAQSLFEELNEDDKSAADDVSGGVNLDEIIKGLNDLNGRIEGTEETTRSSGDQTDPADGDDPFAPIARWKQTTDKGLSTVSIPFFSDDTYGAYARGLEEKQAIVLIYVSELCLECEDLLARFRCPALSRYGGRFVFGLTNPAHDEVGETIRKALEIEQYPTMVVLVPHPDEALQPLAKVAGSFSVAEITDVLDKVVASDAYLAQLDPPAPLPSVDEVARLQSDWHVEPPGAQVCDNSAETNSP